MGNRATQDHESGVALITALLIIAIAGLLTLVMVDNSNHSSTASARNRSWGAAVHIAESGVHQAIASLQSTNGATTGAVVSGTTAEGSYEYKVTQLPRRRYQIDAVGTVGADASLGASRRLRVVMMPPRSFGYALFSLSDVTTKNNNVVCGDIWANTNVVVYNNDAVRAGTDPSCGDNAGDGSGSVTAATGYVEVRTNGSIAGDIWTGGYDDASSRAVILSGGVQVGGSVKASSSAPGCDDDVSHAKYKVSNSGAVGGTITTWGTVSGSGSSAGVVTMSCSGAPTPKEIPPFTFNPANYDSVQTFTVSQFATYLASHRTALEGAFYVTGGGASDAIDLSGVDISGDLTIIAETAPIDANGVGATTGNTDDKLVTLVSYYQAEPSGCQTNGGNPGDCAIGFKNNFAPGDNTAVLLYAPNGPVAFKNNADFHGAVYANNIQVKNNMNVYYDSRVDQVVGFGPVTLDISQWLECTPGVVTTASC
jgi:hypothetical protein